MVNAPPSWTPGAPASLRATEPPGLKTPIPRPCSDTITQEAGEGPGRGSLKPALLTSPRKARAQCTLTKSPAASQTLKGVPLPTHPAPTSAPGLPPAPPGPQVRAAHFLPWAGLSLLLPLALAVELRIGTPHP